MSRPKEGRDDTPHDDADAIQTPRGLPHPQRLAAAYSDGCEMSTPVTGSPARS